jgi:hypothetical protein
MYTILFKHTFHPEKEGGGGAFDKIVVCMYVLCVCVCVCARARVHVIVSSFQLTGCITDLHEI